jgi:hypothetical protein
MRRRARIKLECHGTCDVQHSAVSHYYIISAERDHCRNVAVSSHSRSAPPYELFSRFSPLKTSCLPGLQVLVLLVVVHGSMQGTRLESVVLAIGEVDVVVNHATLRGSDQDNVRLDHSRGIDNKA